ncbi:aldehyde dehydrogenase family protein [Fulvimarina endophytica]|uniref:Aldehyde dehydrogenase family protein n=1 Tax=Fulvimarina endophytica TaxID=2293836 RepID=A0A371WZ71_9HYPH|nr:aldehyde dehydrogenase family protein [Fulvimarina endophytica]RFC62226.1 aldehyde dehydrogenase family protein [Fulvimarina endophytica]
MTIHFGFERTKLFIGGQWQDGAKGETIDVEDPSTGERIGRIARGTAADVDAAVSAAEAALAGDWGRKTATERGRILARLGTLVEANAERLAELESRDVGKPLDQARNDAKALARYFEFYGASADKVTGETIPYQAGTTVMTLREPHGVTAHIIPWNYPMQILGRSVGAALAMGNACVLKPAEDASLSALAIAELSLEAGLPAGALNIVTGYGHDVGSALSGHARVHHVSFTGSVGTGQRIQEAASANVVPVTLELGGKSPHIVFDDCDLEAALTTLVGACIQAAGQTCSAASRVLVQRGIYDEVKRRMAEIYSGLVAGPARDCHALGPLVSARQKTLVTAFIEEGRRDLAIAAEGTIAEGAPSGGHYVAPILFADVAPDHRLAREEIFGPVQVLIPFEDEAEAVRIANGTEYGLVAGVWTENGARQMRIARALHCGQVFINNYGAGGGVELPFGGVGKSGHGREKGFEALYGFSRLKTVSIKHG